MTTGQAGSSNTGGVADEAEDGFRRFVESHSRALLRAGWLLTGDWYTAEDLVQTALAAAWPKWTSLTRPDAPQLYVHRVMVTTFLRWRGRRWAGEMASGAQAQDAAVPDWSGAVDVRRSLLPALGALPPRQRAVVVLRYFADLSEAQTAELLGCSVGSVKRHASRALATLRRMPDLAEIMRGGVTP
jgi:RNA polymerase sigma-70 factor (sigma-E family)